MIKNLKKLIIEKKRRKEEVSHLLLENKLSEASKNVQWIELADKIIKEKRNRQKFTWALILAIVVLLIIGLLFTQSISDTDIQAEIYCTGLTVSLNNSWKFSKPLRADNITITKIVELNTTDKLNTFKNAVDLEVNGDRIKLKQLHISKEAKLEIQNGKDELRIFIRNGVVSGVMFIRDGRLKIGRQSVDIKANETGPPAIYKFRSDSIPLLSSPLVLTLKKNTAWKFENASFDTLEFVEEFPPNSGEFISTINSGKIYFKETEKSINLVNYENLLLVNQQSKSFAMLKDHALIKFLFTGRVSDLNLRKENTLTNLKPTYFEYFYNNRPLTLFWGIVVFMGSLLWSIRNTLFSK